MTKTYPYRILRSQEFTSSGNFVAPADEVFVSGVGGGGGGGGSSNGSKSAPGGGSGCSCFRHPVSIVKGEIVTVTIANGGIGGVATNYYSYSNGGDGGSTSFGSYITLPGGKGANNNDTTTQIQSGAGGGIGAGDAILYSSPRMGKSPSYFPNFLIPGCSGGYIGYSGGKLSYFHYKVGGIADVGGGGGASLFSSGGNGGNNSNGSNGNMGAGGGGSGGLSTSYSGGNGGSGYLKVEWWEWHNLPETKSYPCRILKSQEFTSSGTFVCPSDELFITAVAGGGGGHSSTYKGGGGAAIYKFPILIKQGESTEVTIGTGGTVGNKGGVTSFGNYLSIEGGDPGTGSGHGAGGGPFGVAGAIASSYSGLIISGSGGGAIFNYIKSSASEGSTFFGGGAANTGGGGGVNSSGYSGKLIVEWWEYK